MFPGYIQRNKLKIVKTGFCTRLVHTLNCMINGTVHIFFLKSHISAQNSPIFFPSVIYPLYLHVIIDFSHIWGPFMAEIEKMCQKSAFLVVPDFGYPQSRGPP